MSLMWWQNGRDIDWFSNNIEKWIKPSSSNYPSNCSNASSIGGYSKLKSCRLSKTCQTMMYIPQQKQLNLTYEEQIEMLQDKRQYKYSKAQEHYNDHYNYIRTTARRAYYKPSTNEIILADQYDKMQNIKRQNKQKNINYVLLLKQFLNNEEKSLNKQENVKSMKIYLNDNIQKYEQTNQNISLKQFLQEGIEKYENENLLTLKQFLKEGCVSKNKIQDDVIKQQPTCSNNPFITEVNNLKQNENQSKEFEQDEISLKQFLHERIENSKNINTNNSHTTNPFITTSKQPDNVITREKVRYNSNNPFYNVTENNEKTDDITFEEFLKERQDQCKINENKNIDNGPCERGIEGNEVNQNNNDADDDKISFEMFLKERSNANNNRNEKVTKSQTCASKENKEITVMEFLNNENKELTINEFLNDKSVLKDLEEMRQQTKSNEMILCQEPVQNINQLPLKTKPLNILNDATFNGLLKDRSDLNKMQNEKLMKSPKYDSHGSKEQGKEMTVIEFLNNENKELTITEFLSDRSIIEDMEEIRRKTTPNERRLHHEPLKNLNKLPIKTKQAIKTLNDKTFDMFLKEKSNVNKIQTDKSPKCNEGTKEMTVIEFLNNENKELTITEFLKDKSIIEDMDAMSRRSKSNEMKLGNETVRNINKLPIINTKQISKTLNEKTNQIKENIVKKLNINDEKYERKNENIKQNIEKEKDNNKITLYEFLKEEEENEKQKETLDNDAYNVQNGTQLKPERPPMPININNSFYNVIQNKPGTPDIKLNDNFILIETNNTEVIEPYDNQKIQFIDTNYNFDIHRAVHLQDCNTGNRAILLKDGHIGNHIHNLNLTNTTTTTNVQTGICKDIFHSMRKKKKNKSKKTISPPPIGGNLENGLQSPMWPSVLLSYDKVNSPSKCMYANESYA